MPSVTDLAAGNSDLLISDIPECVAQVRSGRPHALALTGPRRHAQLPEVPMAREAGIAALEMTNRIARMPHAAVPQAVRATFTRHTLTTLGNAALRRRGENAGFETLN